jgi:Mrp family chromosome partitioning ATPase
MPLGRSVYPEMANMAIPAVKAGRVWRNPADTARTRSRLGWLRRLLRDSRTKGSTAALSYRFLARQIDVDLPHTEAGRTILISSSVPQGSSNEAVLMFAHAMVAELGSQILVVDGTLGDDAVGDLLGHAGEVGLIDFIHGRDRSVADLIKPTTRQNICVLPAGRPRSGDLQPMEAARVVALYTELRNRFDYILVQQGPIILDTRYLVFAAKADLVLVLVEEGVTHLSELDRCLDTFSSHQIAEVRLVLCAPP